jgi:hypothetical protein
VPLNVGGHKKSDSAISSSELSGKTDAIASATIFTAEFNDSGKAPEIGIGCDE